jgi:glycosyltransferase involved in cell wall biosynthesis
VPAKLVIVGDGPQRKELEKLADKLDIFNNIWFAGHQQNPYKFMAKSDLLVLSSRFESFGVVLVEAMACGIPVIASDCDFGPREIIENRANGFLVPVGDEKAMAEAIEYLLTNYKIRKKFIREGKETAKKFIVKKAIEKYQILFKKLLENKSSRYK